tara:strand:- start:239 stop:472 length:234 start_codon:yes stop_codon:yes gene_type:complete
MTKDSSVRRRATWIDVLRDFTRPLGMVVAVAGFMALTAFWQWMFNARFDWNELQVVAGVGASAGAIGGIGALLKRFG